MAKNLRSPSSTPDDLLDGALESSVERAVLRALGGTTSRRRRVLRALGGGSLLAALRSVLPIDRALAAAKETTRPGKPLEKTALKVGFVPITCATPIIMAHPMGFYRKYGLDVEVVKTAGWAVARDKSLSGEYDASHMLTPHAAGHHPGRGIDAPCPTPCRRSRTSTARRSRWRMAHKDNRDPKQWKGMKFAVPFEYSMHNFLLRYYVAEHGLDPDKDIQIRVLPPPEMVANLKAGNVDGYLAPDPFNQRAVYEKVGFIHLLSKEIWDGHPCCAFAASTAFASKMPEHLRRPVPGHRRRHPLRRGRRSPQGDRRRHRARQLPEPAA